MIHANEISERKTYLYFNREHNKSFSHAKNMRERGLESGIRHPNAKTSQCYKISTKPT